MATAGIELKTATVEDIRTLKDIGEANVQIIVSLQATPELVNIQQLVNATKLPAKYSVFPGFIRCRSH